MGNWLQDAWNWGSNEASRLGYQASRASNAVQGLWGGGVQNYDPSQYDQWGVKGGNGSVWGSLGNTAKNMATDAGVGAGLGYAAGAAGGPLGFITSGLGALTGAGVGLAQSLFDDGGNTGTSTASNPSQNGNTGAQGAANPGVSQQQIYKIPQQPTAPTTVTPQNNPIAQNPYTQNLIDSVNNFQKQQGQILSDVQNLQNPYDTNSAAFQHALAQQVDNTTQQWNGAEGAAAVQNAERGMAGGGGAAIGNGLIQAQRRAALSGATNQMYTNAFNNGGQFALQKANAEADIARGDLSGASSIYSNLLGQSTAQNNFNQNMTNTQNQEAINNNQNQQRIDLSQESLDWAKTQHLDDQTASAISGIINAAGNFGPTLLKLWKNGQLSWQDLLGMGGTGGSTAQNTYVAPATAGGAA